MNIPPFLETIPAQLLACLASGLFLAISFGLVVLLGKAWRHAWAWIDDSRPGRNPVLELMARLRGWTPWDTQGSSSIYLWWKDKKRRNENRRLFLAFLHRFLGAPVDLLGREAVCAGPVRCFAGCHCFRCSLRPPPQEAVRQAHQRPRSTQMTGDSLKHLGDRVLWESTGGTQHEPDRQKAG